MIYIYISHLISILFCYSPLAHAITHHYVCNKSDKQFNISYVSLRFVWMLSGSHGWMIPRRGRLRDNVTCVYQHGGDRAVHHPGLASSSRSELQIPAVKINRHRDWDSHAWVCNWEKHKGWYCFWQVIYPTFVNGKCGCVGRGWIRHQNTVYVFSCALFLQNKHFVSCADLFTVRVDPLERLIQ